VPPSQLTLDSVDGSQLENLLAPFELLDHPQTLINSPALIEEDFPPSSNTSEEVLGSKESFTSGDIHETIGSCQSSPQPSPASSTSHPDPEPSAVLLLTRSHSVNIRSVSDGTFEDPIVDPEVSSTQSPSWPSTPAQPDLQCLRDTNDYNVHMNISINSTFGNAFALLVDIILVTPPGSPIFEGLSHYMISHGSEVPFRVGQDNASTPVQRDISSGERTLWPLLALDYFHRVGKR
jgi:hypothetical protein